ncbi:MAG TPA: threonine-phosphate decarboxylase [Firmicutes bacterium]|nr:threonine-phosphate decarboxylase [Bacillota bacterium]
MIGQVKIKDVKSQDSKSQDDERQVPEIGAPTPANSAVTGGSPGDHRRRVHGGNIREAMERYGLSPGLGPGLGAVNIHDPGILDFSANINPLGLSRRVEAAIIENLPGITRYPDPECVELRRAIAEHLDISPANIIAGNGAVELVYLITKAARPRLAVVPCPTFSEYALAVESEGGAVKSVYLQPGRGFSIDVEEISSTLPGADILFICNPNNPTGNLWPREALLYIAGEAARTGTLVVVDEAFIDFIDDEKQGTVVGEVPRRKNLIVLRSMTKAFAMPGLRLGYAVCPSEMVQRLASLRDPWSVNSLAQVAGIEALRDRDYIMQTKELIRRERSFLYDGLASLPGVEAYRPEANFILARLVGSTTASATTAAAFTTATSTTTAAAPSAADLAGGLGRRGILIRDASSFDGLDETYFRVAVRTRPENERLLEALRDYLLTWM